MSKVYVVMQDGYGVEALKVCTSLTAAEILVDQCESRRWIEEVELITDDYPSDRHGE